MHMLWRLPVACIRCCTCRTHTHAHIRWRCSPAAARQICLPRLVEQRLAAALATWHVLLPTHLWLAHGADLVALVALVATRLEATLQTDSGRSHQALAAQGEMRQLVPFAAPPPTAHRGLAARAGRVAHIALQAAVCKTALQWMSRRESSSPSLRQPELQQGPSGRHACVQGWSPPLDARTVGLHLVFVSSHSYPDWQPSLRHPLGRHESGVGHVLSTHSYPRWHAFSGLPPEQPCSKGESGAQCITTSDAEAGSMDIQYL